MADRISARRGLANSFFLTANTGVVAVLGSQDVGWYLAAAGVFVAVTWWALLKSYRDLNTAKFEIILAMEERLPDRVYGDEWNRLRTEPVRFSLRPAAVMACAVPRAWPCRARRALDLRSDLPGRDSATVAGMTYLDELAAEIERRGPRDLLPHEDTGSPFCFFPLFPPSHGTP